MLIELTLPYPPSANRYWRTRVVLPSMDSMAAALREGGIKALYKFLAEHSFVNTYVSADAKAFKEAVGWIARKAGIRTPLQGRIEIAYALHPKLPQDWRLRARRDPAGWDDTVQCMDLDNANKVLLDALKGVVFEDDKWVRKITAQRGAPMPEACLVVFVGPMRQQPQHEESQQLELTP